ncbi:cell wall-binding repeat-containing protein [Halalkalibacter akibai]|uniref:GH18 domain-containing protein n=1 Tax=Halalkalibacter akibai (strain ATCC 43226 / DSM 21942 / CIP 109018 / JCM 9157 / 1139) TaxID=1236973 RepID=W4QUF6_HALA3|nr:cell wall-binding repeat-containing protein [Halalkalibacter akibai]GAE35805.1 hypothetical protein JCM9157_2942 [Halalkalibacter akibai JCM 9157]
MDFFTKTRLEKRGDEYHLILYISPDSTEFSVELDGQDTKQRKRIDRLALDYARRVFPNFKITTVSIMVGSLLLASVPMNDRRVEAADFTMSYLFFGSTQAQIGFVDRTKGNLQVVAPSYFDLNPDGSLKLSWQFDPAFIREMNKRGIRVVPFLSNHWDRELGRAALSNRNQLAQQIADTIMLYNLDGVNVDIENVTHLDRDNFTDLVRLIREKLPTDKEVSVAVAANPNNWQTGWHGSYDYKKLAEHSDYLMLMAYDESFNGSPAGPVASYGWVERSITELLKHAPKEKIVLGLPFFGRYWIDGEAASLGGRGIPKAHVETLVSRFNGTVTFDEKSKSPYARFTIPSSFTIGSTTYRPGTYTAWFENADSLKAKVELVHKYKLKGTGSWALGQENPVIWGSYMDWLIDPNLLPPSDVIEEGNTEKAYTELQGDNRYHTSVVISKHGWKQSDSVVLGRGDVPIDALTGSVLAKKHNSPLLLTRSNQLPPEVAEEIQRLKPKRIFLAGGEVAISNTVKSQLEKQGYQVTRISGSNRFDTSVQMANQIKHPTEIILTTGNDLSSDPLSIAPYAGMKQIPILLSGPERLPQSVVNYIRTNNIKKVTVIGGVNAINETALTELKGLGVTTVERVHGQDRYQTSIAIANRFSSSFTSNNIFFASGVSFVDALPGSPLAAMSEAPIVLTGPTSLPKPVKDWLQQNSKSDLYFLGGTNAINQSVRNEIANTIK